MDDLQVRSFRGKEGLAACKSDWDLVLATLTRRRYFHRYEWYRSYLDTLATDPDSVRFHVAYRARSPVAVFPLRSTTRRVLGVPARVLELPSHNHMPHADFVFEPSHENRGLVAALARHLEGRPEGRWDLLALEGLLEGSAARFALTCEAPGRLRWTVAGHCDYLECLPQAQLIDRVSKNFRGNLRKARNKLKLLPDAVFRSTRAGEALAQNFAHFLQVEASGWKGTAGSGGAIALSSSLTEFYRTLLALFAAGPGCEVNVLALGDHCVAGQFCLLSDDTCYLLKIGYDEEHAALAPGNLLLENTVDRYASEGRLRYLNLASGAAWHESWNPERHVVFNALVLSSSVRGRLIALLMAAKDRIRPLYHRWFARSDEPAAVSPAGDPPEQPH